MKRQTGIGLWCVVIALRVGAQTPPEPITAATAYENWAESVAFFSSGGNLFHIRVADGEFKIQQWNAEKGLSTIGRSRGASVTGKVAHCEVTAAGHVDVLIDTGLRDGPHDFRYVLWEVQLDPRSKSVTATKVWNESKRESDFGFPRHVSNGVHLLYNESAFFVDIHGVRQKLFDLPLHYYWAMNDGDIALMQPRKLVRFSSKRSFRSAEPEVPLRPNRVARFLESFIYVFAVEDGWAIVCTEQKKLVSLVFLDRDFNATSYFVLPDDRAWDFAETPDGIVAHHKYLPKAFRIRRRTVTPCSWQQEVTDDPQTAPDVPSADTLENTWIVDFHTGRVAAMRCGRSSPVASLRSVRVGETVVLLRPRHIVIASGALGMVALLLRTAAIVWRRSRAGSTNRS